VGYEIFSGTRLVDTSVDIFTSLSIRVVCG